MTQTIQRKLNDSGFARWTALILISLMMFFAYMFVDMLSPLKELLDTTLNWNSTTFGTYAASEYFLNVFCFFLDAFHMFTHLDFVAIARWAIEFLTG